MGLINFRSTSFLKAFILYAIVTAISASLAIEIRLSMENEKSHIYKLVNPLTPENGITHIHKIAATIFITFIASIIIYHIMYFIFGWGGGMLVKNLPIYGKYFD